MFAERDLGSKAQMAFANQKTMDPAMLEKSATKNFTRHTQVKRPQRFEALICPPRIF
jgi:hypothetical protein